MTDPQSRTGPAPSPYPGPPPVPPQRRHSGRNIGIGVAVAAAVAVGTAIAVAATTGAAPGRGLKAEAKPTATATFTEPVVEETTQAPTSPSETKVRIGQTLSVSQDGVEAGEITAAGVTSTQAAPNEFASRPANGNYVTFTITAKATATGTFDINPFDFYFRATDGRHLDLTAGNAVEATRDDDLSATTLNPGETVKGTIVFDLPGTHGELVYAPLSQALGSWNF